MKKLTTIATALALLLAMVVTAPVAANSDIHVYEGDSIQTAIDNASAGDVIIVHEGTYYENVEVNKSIALRGDGIAVVDAGGAGSAITITADSCTVDGLTLTGATDFWAQGAGIAVMSDNNILDNNVSHDNWVGIYLVGSNGDTLRRNVMLSNHFNFAVINGYIHDIDTSNMVDGKPMYYLVNENGVLIDSTTNAGFVAAVNSTEITVRNLTIGNNRQGVLFVDTANSRIDNVNVTGGHESIMLLGSDGNSIVRSTVSDSGKLGIVLDNSDNNVIKHNTLTNDPIGITLIHGATSNDVYQNSIADSAQGIYVYDSSNDNQVIGNKVASPTDEGIWVLRSTGNLIKKNKLTDSSGRGIILDDANGNQVIGNEVAGSTYAGISVRRSTGNLIEKNKVADNRFGIELGGANDNQVIGNKVASSTYDGISVGGSTGNLIKKNKVADSGQWDLYDSSAALPPLDNTWEKNKYETANF